MKNYIFALLISVLLLNSGCIKNEPVLYTAPLAEFDATAVNANSGILTYPILGRIPGFGRVANTSDSTLRRLNGTVILRVNLVGAQSSTAQTVGYEIFSQPSSLTTFAMPASIAGQTPSALAGTLTVTNAVAGTNYSVLPGILTIPANSSFGYLAINILRSPATVGAAVFLGIKLNSSGSIKPSVNYSEIGLVIDQR